MSQDADAPRRTDVPSDDEMAELRGHTRAYQQMYDALVHDVKGMVDSELDSREVPLEDLREMVRAEVKKEQERRANQDGWSAAIKPALLATAFTSVLALSFWGVSTLMGGTEEGATSSAENVTTPVAEERRGAADYDGLLLGRDSALVSLVSGAGTLAADSALQASLSEWMASPPTQAWGGADSIAHHVLVRSALRTRMDSTLTVSGEPVVDSACTSAACQALGAYWRAQASTDDYPSFSEELSAASLATIERLLVLDHGNLR